MKGIYSITRIITCFTPSGIEFSVVYEYEPEEKQTFSSPGSPENLTAWIEKFTSADLAVADAWVQGSYGVSFSQDEIDEIAHRLDDMIIEESWNDVIREKALAEEYAAESRMED